MIATQTNRILILGASGMLGNAIFRYFSNLNDFEVFGSVRSNNALKYFPEHLRDKIISNVNVENQDSLVKLFNIVNPNIVINCIGIVKQLSASEDPLEVVPINTLLPHRVARLCSVANARFIHMSTDCVFSGMSGNYVEEDTPDARDFYGISKFMGEVDYNNAITLRTSIIGHELDGSRSLINWFLSQENTIQGYTKAIFSGLPTVEIAKIIHEYVIPHPELHGLYHVSANPINKYDLLQIVNKIYNKNILITPNESLSIDRSLDSSKFRLATGFQPKSWPDLIQAMHDFK
jgi:dTDP-4-dehydrorhamnose reductase